MNILLPSLKITGGNIEAIKLINEISDKKLILNNENLIYTLWHCKGGIEVFKTRVIFLSTWHAKRFLAPFQIPYLLMKFNNLNKGVDREWIFTHYSTLPFSFFIKKNKRFFFVQDLEWKFIKNKILRFILKKLIIKTYSKGNILVANDYLENAISKNGLDIYGNINIWADGDFLGANISEVRDIDGVMVLRKGSYKRLDLYREFISKCSLHKSITLAIITPEKVLFNEFKNSVQFCYFSPALHDMREIYSRAKVFIHLSDHEGFGLPPLESMGAGCVPLCRDSGGVRAYMETLKEDGLMLPNSCCIDDVFEKFHALISDVKNMEMLSDKVIKVFIAGLGRDKFNFFLKKINN
jgi:glycosyltransferase involved in cell wall biosynthesis